MIKMIRSGIWARMVQTIIFRPCIRLFHICNHMTTRIAISKQMGKHNAIEIQLSCDVLYVSNLPNICGSAIRRACRGNISNVRACGNNVDPTHSTMLTVPIVVIGVRSAPVTHPMVQALANDENERHIAENDKYGSELLI